jgi:hypothetical protein
MDLRAISVILFGHDAARMSTFKLRGEFVLSETWPKSQISRILSKLLSCSTGTTTETFSFTAPFTFLYKREESNDQ